ncbi:Glu/Leu/Phe/Val dehydrogenase dimerization domain-containing protein [Desulfoscipio gibsoniae]
MGAFSTVIGPEANIPAPDVNTTPQTPGWIMDKHSKSAGKNT